MVARVIFDCRGIAPVRGGLAVWLQAAPQHFLYFLFDPHGHGSLRPTFGVAATWPLRLWPRDEDTILDPSFCMTAALRVKRAR